MAEKLTLVGCPSPDDPIYNGSPDIMADLLLPIPLYSIGKILPLGTPNSLRTAYFPVHISVPREPGTYYFDKVEAHRQARETTWSKAWVGVLSSVNGDHHRPNPLLHSWAGGELVKKSDNSVTFPWSGFSSVGESTRFYPSWDGKGDIPTNGSLISTVGNGTSTAVSSIFEDGGEVRNTPRASTVTGFRSDVSQVGCYAWATSGQLRPASNPNLYGPNFMQLTELSSGIHLHLWSYRSWTNKYYHADLMCLDQTYTATVYLRSVEVRSNLSAVASYDVVYRGVGYYASSGNGKDYPDDIFDIQAVKSYTYAIAASRSKRHYPTLLEVASWGTFVRGAVWLRWLHYHAQSMRLEDMSKYKEVETRAAALRNQDELESNWIENAVGFSNPLGLLTSVSDIGVSIKKRDPVGVFKSLAGAYLQWKYVIAPGVSDYNDIQKNAGRLFEQYISSVKEVVTRQSSGTKLDPLEFSDLDASNASWSSTYSMKMDRSPWSRIWRALCAFGIEPSASNFWDLIPYSFVIDWFVPVGKYLATASKQLELTLNYTDVRWSSGFSNDASFPSPSLGWEGNITFRYYHRIVGTGAGGLSPFFAGTSVDPRLSASQKVQGLALLVQRLR